MEWLQTTLGVEDSSGLQLILITLGLAVGLILIVWIFRKIFGVAARRASRNRVPRLSVTDQAYVDDKRRLIIVRRDNVEHLVMVGGPTDVVVESGIVRMQKTTPSSSPPVSETPSQVPAPPVRQPEEAKPASVKTGEEKSPEPPVQVQSEPVAQKETVKTTTATVASAAVVAAGVSVMEDTLSDPTEEKQTEIEDTITEEVAVVPVEDTPDTHETEDIAVATEEIIAAEPSDQEIDLESTISASLDDALSSQPIVIDEPAVEAPTPEDTAGDTKDKAPDRGDDEMQRLLDELAEETKELA